MFIITKLTIDMVTGEVLVREGFFYEGLVAECKGDDTAKAAEQQQAAFDSQLMQMMQQQYGNQSQVFQFLKGVLQPNISKPTGYADNELAAMRTSATDALSTEYNNAQKALNNEENQKNGGSDLPAGTKEQLDAALLNSEAQDKANVQNNITVANANLKQQNYWNSINALNGVGAEFNPVSYADAATSGSNAVSNLSQAVTASSGPTFGSILGGVVGAGLGAAGSYFGAKKG